MPDLSSGATTAWRTAVIEAWEDQYPNVEKEHIFIGLLSLGKVLDAATGDARFDKKILQEIRGEFVALSVAIISLGLDITLLRREVRHRTGKGSHVHKEKNIHRSEACKQMFSRAEILSKNSRITALHIMAAILENPGPIISESFQKTGADSKALREKILACIGEKSDAPSPEIETEKEKKKLWEKKSILERLGRDLVEEAKAEKLGPYVGRRKEILQTIQTLARSTKNNPVLLGEPGVGKTAIVEAIALSIFEKKAPPIMEGKRIIEINMAVLIGGTKHRGEFEKRLNEILDEAIKDKGIILFIDEIHNLIGSGRTEGSMDAANILKPVLARGEIKCIGATTIAEYRRYIESDTALERRFEKIIINEPSRDEAIEILKGIKDELELHHQVMISDIAIEKAVDLSIRFDGDHQLPDKAIDLLDQAGARNQIPMIETMHKTRESNLDESKIPEITEKDIIEELSIKTGLPKELISGHFNGEFQSRLQLLEEGLKERIKGQDEALMKICRRLFIAYAGLRERRGPLAVYLLLGPSGVGKTETAKALALLLFGSESSIIRLDMSEYMEEHSVSKLLGSPPGYVGYKEEGQLVSKLRSIPYSIVLLDEIEKAHPRVVDIFLQVFDEGRLTDAKGRTIDAKNAIFIITSNIGGSDSGNKMVGFFHDESKNGNKTDEALKAFFRTELLNRIDEKITYRALDEKDIKEILQPMLKEINNNLQKKYHVNLTVSPEVKSHLALKGYSREFGARGLRRTVEELLEIPVSALIIEGKIKNHLTWKAILEKDSISLEPEER
ncbi:MAG: ATP-dependent Clp protease ATP-binding subunit [Deltaproteobacteria bacterium]|nr:ATP-dependent Clp protease ATP-binding subunit [Deltaproteobacteria bacterium]